VIRPRSRPPSVIPRAVAPSANFGDRSAFASALLIAAVFALAFVAPRAAPQNVPQQNAASPTASLPLAWTHWKYFRAIDLPPAQAERFVKFRVPPEIFAHAQPSLADLRVIDDRAAQTPYVLRIASGQTKTQTLAVRQLESSYVPGQYTQIVLDAGQHAPFHNSLEIDTGLPDFIAWARVEVSDDARTWREVTAAQPLYRFAQKGGAHDLTLDYSPSNARYIRLRIYDKKEKFPLTAASIQRVVAIPRENQPVATIPAVDSAQQGQKTIWSADLPQPLPVDSVRIDSSASEFDRSVQIFSSDDNAHWSWQAAGKIYRFYSPLPPGPLHLAGPSEPNGHYAHLTCDFPPHAARYWRVEVENGNDAPLADAKVELSMAARDIIFRQEPGRNYLLLYGQSQLRIPPQYDLSQTITEPQMNSAFAAWALGPERVNAVWQDPRPWTERHAIVLWLAVILAALALTFIAIQSLKSSPPPEQE
jgi:Protein of unknown function (DUF3999)